PNRQDQHGDTPLMAAVRVGSIDATTLLLEARADPNRKDRMGRSAWHWAARSGRVDMVHSLINAGALVDVVDDTGRTAMAYAREKGHQAIAEVLHNNGARETSGITIRATLTPREAVENSLPLLVRGWQSWSQRQSCGACHHRLMIDRVAALATQRGFTAVTSLAADQMQFFMRSSVANEPRLREQLSSEKDFLRSA